MSLSKDCAFGLSIPSLIATSHIRAQARALVQGGAVGSGRRLKLLLVIFDARLLHLAVAEVLEDLLLLRQSQIVALSDVVFGAHRGEAVKDVQDGILDVRQ